MFKNKRFSTEEVDQLAELMEEVKGHGGNPIADGIKRLLRSGYIREDITFARSHMEAMAKEVARGVAEGQELRLGRLCSERGPQQEAAIFLWNEEWTDGPSEEGYQGYVFTSSSERENENDIHRHVCLDVSWEGSDGEIPQLYTRRGILGLHEDHLLSRHRRPGCSRLCQLQVEILDGNSFQLGTACIPKGGQGPVAVNGRNYFVTATTSCGLGFLGTQTHPSDWQLKLIGNC
ncbi:hypothetical protein CGCTS75_v002810 [Colletotrichum tropicale]|nr:hypothetical protein CGCTS75_v002810 [Colletotrichum tropicale]